MFVKMTCLTLKIRAASVKKVISENIHNKMFIKMNEWLDWQPSQFINIVGKDAGAIFGK